MSAIIDALGSLLLNPIVTGSLLLLLLRGSPEVQATALQWMTKVPGDAAVNLDRAVKALKLLFALGAVSTFNSTLNRVLWGQWPFRQPGESFNWKNGKEIIVITGGASGFGRLMAKDFSTKGKIVVIDVSELPKDMQSLPNLHFYRCDLTKPDQIAKTAAAIKAEVGAPTVLINNAGIARAGTILDSSPEWIEKIFRANLLSHWQLVAEFLPGMLKQRKGHIVTMASVASFVSIPDMVDYCSCKAGVLAFHQGLVRELGSRYENGECIRTTVIHPLWARTGIIADHHDRLKKARQAVMEPEVVTKQIERVVLSGRSGGQIVVPNSSGLLSMVRAWPSWLHELVLGGAVKMAGI